MRFFSQHELGGSREGIEPALRQRAQLKLAVAVGEVSEHEQRQPIRRALVERSENARVVDVAAAALEQCIRLFAAVTAKVTVQQIDHCPEMTAFFHIDLE